MFLRDPTVEMLLQSDWRYSLKYATVSGRFTMHDGPTVTLTEHGTRSKTYKDRRAFLEDPHAMFAEVVKLRGEPRIWWHDFALGLVYCPFDDRPGRHVTLPDREIELMEELQSRAPPTYAVVSGRFTRREGRDVPAPAPGTSKSLYGVCHHLSGERSIVWFDRPEITVTEPMTRSKAYNDRRALLEDERVMFAEIVKLTGEPRIRWIQMTGRYAMPGSEDEATGSASVQG